MSSIHLIPRVIERDVKILFSDTFLIGIMFANFCIDLFVTAATFGNLIGSSYFLRIAPGSNLITAMVAAFQSGRDIWREKYIKDFSGHARHIVSLRHPVQSSAYRSIRDCRGVFFGHCRPLHSRVGFCFYH